MVEGTIPMIDNRVKLMLYIRNLTRIWQQSFNWLKKLGISTRKLTNDEIEDYGLSIAISEGKTGEYVDTETFLSELRDGAQD